MCTDVEVAQRRHVEHVKPAYFVASGAGVVVEDVVVNQHVVRSAVGVVEVAVPFDVVSFAPSCNVDELEPVIATHPKEVGANVSHQTGHVIVATVQYPVAFGKRCQPLVGRDVVAEDAESFGSDVGDIAHDLYHSVAGLRAFAPIVVVLKVGFRNEANARCCATVDVVAVHSNAVGCPVRHAVVDVLAVIDAHGCKIVFTYADVCTCVQTSAAPT